VRRTLSGADISQVEELLEPVFDRGTTIGNPPDIDELRARRLQDLERLDEGVRRLVNPHVYHVSLTSQMKRLQRSLISEALASG
jgi:nicotinate phosphoribosyltransferase